jgi:hypothetical protein
VAGLAILARRIVAAAAAAPGLASRRWHASGCIDRESNQVVPISHKTVPGAGSNGLTSETGHEYSPTARPYLPN